MPKLIAVLSVMLFLLTACHGYSTPQGNSGPYPHVRAAYDLTIFWKANKSDDAIAISGQVKNNYFPYVTALKLSASLLDESGKILSETTYAFLPNPIPLGQSQRFTLNLPLKAGEKPVKIRFLYRYNEFGAGYIKGRDFDFFEESLP